MLTLQTTHPSVCQTFSSDFAAARTETVPFHLVFVGILSRPA